MAMGTPAVEAEAVSAAAVAGTVRAAAAAAVSAAALDERRLSQRLRSKLFFGNMGCMPTSPLSGYMHAFIRRSAYIPPHLTL